MQTSDSLIWLQMIYENYGPGKEVHGYHQNAYQMSINK